MSLLRYKVGLQYCGISLLISRILIKGLFRGKSSHVWQPTNAGPNTQQQLYQLYSSHVDVTGTYLGAQVHS